jgi:protein SCO1/2
MPNITRRTLLASAALARFAGSLLAGEERPRFSGATISPRERLRQSNFPNVTLTTHEGKKIRFYDDLLKDKVVTINFMYTHCKDLCPLSTANLAKVQKLLGDKVGREIFMYSLTLDPEHDTPQVLKKFADKFHVGPGWYFLTGKHDDLELLRRKLGFVDPSPEVDRDRTNHIGTVEYGNEPLMLWGACPSMAHAEWIVKEISWVVRPQDQLARR